MNDLFQLLAIVGIAVSIWMIVLFVKLRNNVKLLLEATMVGFDLEKRYIAKDRAYVAVASPTRWMER